MAIYTEMELKKCKELKSCRISKNGSLKLLQKPRLVSNVTLNQFLKFLLLSLLSLLTAIRINDATISCKTGLKESEIAVITTLA